MSALIRMRVNGTGACPRKDIGLANASPLKVWGKYREKLILQEDLTFFCL